MKHHLLLPLIAVLAAPLRAATFTVTNSNNSGAGSLRQAISDANATAAADTINFNTAGHFSTARTISLTSGELVITRTTTIDAPAAAGQRVTVSGGNAQRVLSLNPAAAATVTLRNLTLRDGRSTTGGGIQGTGTITALTLNMENCTVTACHADTIGGGMQMLGATVNLTDTTVSANTVSISELRAATGGGIAASGGTLALTRCLISNNDAGGGGSPHGGGVNAGGTDLTATDTTFSFNFSRTGGGIYMSGGTAQLTRCVMTSNAASNVGGGLFADLSGQVTLRDTVFTRNTADEGGGIYAAGAAGGALTADACTFSNNEAQDPYQSGYGSNLGGGGLYLDGRVAVTLFNCTLSRNDSGEHGGGLVTTDRAFIFAPSAPRLLEIASSRAIPGRVPLPWTSARAAAVRSLPRGEISSGRPGRTSSMPAPRATWPGGRRRDSRRCWDRSRTMAARPSRTRCSLAVRPSKRGAMCW